MHKDTTVQWTIEDLNSALAGVAGVRVASLVR